MPGPTPGHPQRALLVTSVLPWPLHRNGGAQRTDLLRRALEQAGYAVDILAVIPQSVSTMPGEDELRANGVVAAFTFDASVVIRPRPRLSPPGFGSFWALDHVRRVWRHRYAPSADVTRWLAARAEQYAVVVARYLQTALVAGLDHRDPVDPPRVLVDLDDVDWLTLESRLGAQPWPGLVGRLGMMIARRTVRQRCIRSLAAFNGLFVTNHDDEAELRKLGHSPALLLNIPYSDPDEPGRLDPVGPSMAAAREVLFVGDLEFGPNVTGLDWFLESCWSRVRQEVPDATLRIVGRGLAEERRQAWVRHAGVEVVGFAENLRGEYERCACTIAPTWWGGGTKIKLVESAALGRACVATPHALRGYEELGQGESSPVVTAGGAEAFSAAVTELLLRPESRQAREVTGAVLVQRRYSFPAFARVVAESVRSAVR